MTSENLKRWWQAAEAFNRRDAEAFAALFAPDGEIVPLRAAIEGTVYRGPDAAARFFAASEESWESLSVEIEEVLDQGGECLVALGLLRGRGRGSGVDVETELAWVVCFRDGLITSLRTYVDADEALAALS